MTNTPSNTQQVTIIMSLENAQLLANSLDHDLRTLANHVQSAVLGGEFERATRLAQEAENLRTNIFARVNRGIREVETKEGA